MHASLSERNRPSHPPTPLRLLIALVLGTLGCGSEPDDHAVVGELALGLTADAAGTTYRLADARFALDGPAPRELVAMGEDELSLTLPAGAYRLMLREGYRLIRSDDASAPSIAARLVSQNPTPVLVSAGQTTRVTLRFELSDAASPDDEGTLHVGIAVVVPDAGARSGSDASMRSDRDAGMDAGRVTPDASSSSSARDSGPGGAACSASLRISELDAEQASSDTAEFVELLNPGSCAVPLADLTLELVNGTDGRPYARYTLSAAGSSLTPGERLVVGDEAVLKTLGASIKQLPLNGAGLQNGPDCVRLVRDGAVVDAIAYGGVVSGCGEGPPAKVDDSDTALARCPDAVDAGSGAGELRAVRPTPGAANACPP